MTESSAQAAWAAMAGARTRWRRRRSPTAPRTAAPTRRMYATAPASTCLRPAVATSAASRAVTAAARVRPG